MEKKRLVFGVHAVAEAVNSGKEFDKVLIKKDSQSPQTNELIKKLREIKIPYQLVPVEKLDRLTGKNHQGVVAFLSAIEYQNIEMLIPSLFEQGKVPFILVLDHLTDVRNLGAIARTAECAGVDAIILPEKGSAEINADAIKTSSGALHSINICRVKSLSVTLKYLKNCGLAIYGASEKSKLFYYEANMNMPFALIMGAEDTGISAECLRICDELVKIPLLGQIKSLNVSVATGVLLFEALRQRNEHFKFLNTKIDDYKIKLPN